MTEGMADSPYRDKSKAKRLTEQPTVTHLLGLMTFMGATVFLWGVPNSSIAQAQVVPDGTLSTTITTTDNLNFLIDGGDRAGANLFHSFDQFSIPTNGSVQFRNAIAIDNIISRVTGSDPSTIDGLIQANGTANLFLLNPNGFLFGPNARLDIGGSFLATTADSFLFEDNITFSATQPEGLLSINTPLGLQMGADPGSIEVQGPGHQLRQFNDLVQTINQAPESLGLAVSPANTLALIGGSLTLEGAVLTAAGGHIELGSAQNGRITWEDQNHTWTFTYTDVDAFQDIQLTQNALVDSTADQAGSISLQGHQIRLSGGSTLLSQNLGDVSAGTLHVYADESLSIRGVNSNNFRSSIRAETLDAGAGSPIDIQSPLVRIKNGGAIRTTTFGSGDSGHIQIQAEDALRVVGISPLASTNGTDVSVIGATAIGGLGNAGDIDIDSQNVRIRDGGVITSSTLLGQGDAGNISIEADSIRLEGESQQIGGAGIFSSTLGEGNAGNISIDTQELVILDGNVVDSASAESGDAGDLKIVASEQVVVSGFGPGVSSDSPQRSAISSAVIILDELTQLILDLDAMPKGDAGNLTIDTPNLRIANSGLVTINNDSGDGNAGQLDISAESIVLANQGSIAAATNTGNGGNVTINAHILRLDNSLINASSLTSGRGGRITIQTDDLRLSGGSRVETSAFDESSGGDIQVNATNIEMIASVLTTSTLGTGRAGNIQIETENLSFREGGQFLTATFDDGDAGMLNVDASGTILLEGHSLSDDPLASGFSAGSLNGGLGNGGNITVSAPLLMIQDGAEISASASAEMFTGFSVNQRSVRSTNHSTRSSSRAVSDSRTTDQIGAQAGDITLDVDTLILNNGRIIALSDQGKGGDINLMVNDGVLLSNMSAISTEAGTVDGGGGNGGNIQIESPFIAAAGNSDITANAFEGDGGNIQIATQGLFNIAFRDSLTPGNDITASSAFGVSGTVSITTPDVDPSADAVLLPTTVNNATEQIATACEANRGSRFVATGQGGLPVHPDGDGDRPWSDILPDLGTIPTSIPITSTPAPPIPFAPSPPPALLLQEATEFGVTANGSIQLMAERMPTLSQPQTCMGH